MQRKLTATLLGLMLAAGASACGPDNGNNGNGGGNDTGMSQDTGDMQDTGMQDSGMTDSGMPDGGGDTGDDGLLGTATGELQEPQSEGGMQSMGSAAPNLEGYTVTAAKVSGEGRTDITGMEAMTDAEGNFSLKVDIEAGAEAEGEAAADTVSDFVVQAQKEGSSSSEVIVSQTLEADSTVKTEPITIESSVESDAYVEARASGEWKAEGEGSGGSEGCMGCTTANLRSMIDADTAAMIDASGQYQSDVEAEAKAVVGGMKAWAQGLMENAGAAESDVKAALEAQTEARGELSAKLHDAESSSEAEAAWETYADAVAKGYSDNNIDADALAVGAHSAAEAMLHFHADLSAQAKQRAKAAAELWRAQKVRASVEAKVEAMAEASMQHKQQVKSAGDALETKLESAATASSDFQAKINQAWADYESSVRTQVFAALKAEADSSVITDFAGTLKSAVVAELNSVKSTYKGALDIGADASTTAAAQTSVQAFGQLWGSLTADAAVKMLTEAEIAGQTKNTGISEGSAESALQAMAHITAAAKASGSASGGN